MIAVVIFWIIAFIMLVCGKFHMETPINYVFLSIHTLANSILVAHVVCKTGYKEILSTISVVVIIVIAVTIYAFKTESF